MKLEILKKIYKKNRVFDTQDSNAKMLCSGRMVAMFCSVFLAYLNSVFLSGTRVYETRVPLRIFFTTQNCMISNNFDISTANLE